MYQKIFPDRMKEIEAYLQNHNRENRNESEIDKSKNNKSKLNKISNIVND